MSKRFDVVADTPRRKDNGYAWTVRIGTGWQRDDGSIDITLDALPISSTDKNGNPQVRLKLWEAKSEGRSYGGGGSGAPNTGGTFPYDMNDDVPFITAEGVL